MHDVTDGEWLLFAHQWDDVADAIDDAGDSVESDRWRRLARGLRELVRDRERVDKLEAAIAAGCVLSMQTADGAPGIVELRGICHPVEGDSLRAAIDCAEAE